jgi:regulator of sigma E protease
MSLAIAIGGLAFLIVIHEAGHFVTALAVRMRPRRFYIFFPPALVKRTWRGIEYGIGSIPLGGYVKIPGMHRPAAGDLEAHLNRAVQEAPWLADVAAPAKRALAEERFSDARHPLQELRAEIARADLSEAARRQAERGLTDLEDSLSPEAYWRAPAWKRIAVILAGPATNLLFAVAALTVVFMLGVPEVVRTIAEVTPNSPAAAAGLRPGDRIVSVGDASGSPRAIADAIAGSRGRSLRLRVERNGKILTLEGRARPNADGDYRLGFSFDTQERSYSFGAALTRSCRATWDVTKGIGGALADIFTGSGRDQVSSVVGITAVSSEAVQQGLVEFLLVLAFISLSLALLNLLPLLPLDGGHIAFSLAEWIRGRAIPREAYERMSAIGIALVLFLFVIGLSNDIQNLGGG